MAAQINPVNWFEIPVNDLDRAKKFYESVFGYALTLEEMGQAKMAFFPMVNDAYGTTGNLMMMEGSTPSRVGTLIYFSVEDIEGTLGKVNANGGKTILPKTEIGQYGFIAHFEDSEGNRVALHSMK